MKLLDGTKHRIVAVDLLGFGKSPKPQNIDYTVEQHVHAVRKTLNRHSVQKPFILVGHSMGSIISAHYSYRYPDEVEQAVLVSLPLYLDEKYLPSKTARWMNNTYMQAYKFVRKNPKFTKSGARSVNRLFKISDKIDVTDKTWVSFTRSLKNTIENQNTFDDIANTTVPITELHGSLDEVIVSGNMKQLNKLKGVKVVTVKGEDHGITDKFAKRIHAEIKI